MKKSILVFICIYSLNFIQAQQKAVTENGTEVILYDDGTWKFQNEDELTIVEVRTNPIKLKKSEGATFLLKSNNLNVGFWLDPKLWSFKKQTENEAAEYKLLLKSGDLYGMIITEKVEIPLETLKSLALANGQKVAPDLKIVKEEYRNVNGLKVLLLEMSGTTQGIKFSYYGYYYSNTNGTVQFITYTSTKLLNSYKSKIEILLNGLVELE
jgi:hypothetical protein